MRFSSNGGSDSFTSSARDSRFGSDRACTASRQRRDYRSCVVDRIDMAVGENYVGCRLRSLSCSRRAEPRAVRVVRATRRRVLGSDGQSVGEHDRGGRDGAGGHAGQHAHAGHIPVRVVDEDPIRVGAVRLDAQHGDSLWIGSLSWRASPYAAGIRTQRRVTVHQCPASARRELLPGPPSRAPSRQ